MIKKITLLLSSLFISTNVYATDITGAGATFPYPVYSKWADEYKKETGRLVNYQSVGSGAGIKQIQAKTVTFGASDMPLSDTELSKNGLFQFPTVIGGNVIVYNLDGIKGLVLTGSVVADIYLGKITKWNHETIKSLNPNLTLPNTNITVVRRSDGSGTTYIFANYLSSVSEEWKNKVGIGTALEWPVGIGAKGNEGIAGNVAQTRNSIGYVEYAYAKQNNLSYSRLEINGDVISANKETFQNGKWPITSPTYILMHNTPSNVDQQKAAFEFFNWAYNKGDKMADDLDYVPLSKEKKLEIINSWR